MNWDAIGAIGEVLGALAVVMTLGYLSVQIRQNTSREKLAQEFASNEYFNQLRMLVASDEELADIEQRGINNLSALSALERRRFDELVTSWLWALQKFYQQDKAEQIAAQFSVTTAPFVYRRFGGIGFVMWWREIREEYSDVEFRDTMDLIVEEIDRKLSNTNMGDA